MLGLISVGAGLSVLPHFDQVERITDIVWRPLVKPTLWTDWALIWRPETASQASAEFMSVAEKKFGGVTDRQQAAL